MKLRLKINPNLTREQLIARLPAIIRTATEAVLEKGQKVHGGIEKDLFKAHPVKAIATSESEFYDQGHASLMGIYSWLSRSLDIETSLIKSFTKDGYKAEFQEKHGVGLGSSVTFDQAKKLSEILGNIPNEVLQDRVRLISVDGKFGSSKKKYPNHGRYYEEHERVVLNPHIFGEETIYRDGKDEAIEKITHTLLHEIGHSIDDDFGFSAKKEWRKISGWKFIGDGEPSKDAERLLLKEGNATTLKGKWSYRKGTTFARWYGARNPKEDFCEAFVFSVLGATQYFKGETGKKKLEFVDKIIDKLIKSEDPGSELEASDDSEILKSQGFKSYYDTRSGGLLHLDELDAVEVAKSEFVDETCGEIYLEKADAPQPGAAPAPAPGAAPKANSGVLNPLKGIMKPGHKYLYREPMAGGGYRYYYQMPNGRHYSSEDALHDEGKHMANFKSDEEWANYKQNITSPEQMPEVSKEGFEGKGGKQEFFEPVAVPNLVEDIKPNEKTFDPNAKEEEESPEAPEEDADWRHKKPSREDQDFQLTVEDEPKIEAALRTWEIEEVDEAWGHGAKGCQEKFRVKLKNDGWAILKPKAGSLKYKSDPNRNMDEMTTIYREALGYEIDKALGWHLVPPTVVRDLKGVGNRKVYAAMKRKVGKDHYHMLDSFSKGKMSEASLQFFAEDVELLSESVDSREVNRQEATRAVIFDMITNHQDRHLNNMMVGLEYDAGNRYGASFRFVLIDNGYMAGYGERATYQSWGTNDRIRSNLGEDIWIDKKTLRSLRKLRDDLRSKSRRRKILSDGVRQNITSDQLDRIAHRIDYILSPKFRDKKGRAQLISWSDLLDWEKKTLPIPEAESGPGWIPDPASEPFDITGKTAIVGEHRGKVKKFTKDDEVKDFLAPVLPYLNKNQKAKLNDFMKHYMRNGFSVAHRPMRDVISIMPKKLVNQLFVKQLFHQRFGFSKDQIRKIDFAVDMHLESDHIGEIKDNIKREHLTAYNRLERGELDLKDLKRVLNKESRDMIENLWLEPKNISGVGKDLTDRIFDDPEHFGWGAEAPREEGRKPFEALPKEEYKSQMEPDLMVSLGDDYA